MDSKDRRAEVALTWDVIGRVTNQPEKVRKRLGLYAKLGLNFFVAVNKVVIAASAEKRQNKHGPFISLAILATRAGHVPENLVHKYRTKLRVAPQTIATCIAPQSGCFLMPVIAEDIKSNNMTDSQSIIMSVRTHPASLVCLHRANLSYLRGSMTCTRSLTSWHMSLSDEHTTTPRPADLPHLDNVAMTSSASKPCREKVRHPSASASAFASGIC